MTYGLALIEKPGVDGLNWNEIRLLYDLVTGGLTGGTAQVFPIELEAREHECAAMGFITPEAAEFVGYDYEGSGLRDFIASILDDMEKENPDKTYQFNGIDIYPAINPLQTNACPWASGAGFFFSFYCKLMYF